MFIPSDPSVVHQILTCREPRLTGQNMLSNLKSLSVAHTAGTFAHLTYRKSNSACYILSVKVLGLITA